MVDVEGTFSVGNLVTDSDKGARDEPFETRRTSSNVELLRETVAFRKAAVVGLSAVVIEIAPSSCSDTASCVAIGGVM